MNLKKRIIAFAGTHGTGKTTSAAKRFVDEKIKNPKARVGFLCEVARDCPLPINRNTSQESQLWIFGRQLEQEIALASKNDLVIADRCLADNISYARVGGFSVLADRLEEIFFIHAGIYQKILFKGWCDNPFLFDDGDREIDPIFRQQVESALLDTLTRAVHRCHGLIVERV